LSGCAKIRTKTENEIIDNNDDTFNISEMSVENDSLIRPQDPPTHHNYVPWQSPSLASRKLIDRVKESPRLARRMLNTMTSPGPRMRGKVKDGNVFVVSMNTVMQECRVGVISRQNKLDSWTSMGEDVTEWIFEYVSETDDNTDNDDESSDESEKDWHILKEAKDSADTERF